MDSATRGPDTSANFALNERKKAAESKCTSWGKTGHTEPNCWKAHPEKTPQWAKDAKKEASGVDITLAGIESDFGRVTL